MDNRKIQFKFVAVKKQNKLVIQIGYKIVIKQVFKNKELVTSSSYSKVLSAIECMKLAKKLGVGYERPLKNYTFVVDSQMKPVDGYITRGSKFVKHCSSSNLKKLLLPK